MLNLFVRMAKRINSEIDYIWMVENLRKVLPNELDFRVEAQNIVRFRNLFQQDMRITAPRVYPDMYNEKLIVMEFVEGINIDNLQELKQRKFDGLEVSRILGECYSR